MAEHNIITDESGDESEDNNIPVIVAKDDDGRLAKLENMMMETMEAVKGMKRKHEEAFREVENDTHVEDDIETNIEHDDQEDWLTDEDDEEDGPPLNDNICKYIEKKVSVRMPDEQLKKKLLRQRKPKNIIVARETKVNTPIYHRLPKEAKKKDLGWKSIQGMLCKAIYGMGKVAEKVLEMGKKETKEKSQLDWSTEMYTDTFDALALASQVSYRINMKRVGNKLLLQTLHVTLSNEA